MHQTCKFSVHLCFIKVQKKESHSFFLNFGSEFSVRSYCFSIWETILKSVSDGNYLRWYFLQNFNYGFRKFNSKKQWEISHFLSLTKESLSNWLIICWTPKHPSTRWQAIESWWMGLVTIKMTRLFFALVDSVHEVHWDYITFQAIKSIFYLFLLA